MEKLRFEFKGAACARDATLLVLVGVVGSGNLEVLVEPASRAAPARSTSRLGARLRLHLGGGAARLSRPPRPGRCGRLHQRHGRDARRGELAARPGGGAARQHRSQSHESQLRRIDRARAGPLPPRPGVVQRDPRPGRARDESASGATRRTGFVRRRRRDRPRPARRPPGARRRAGRRIHGRRRRRGAWRQARRPVQACVGERPAAVLVLAESGGVRLHEANAGLIAVSEVMRALLDARHAASPS